jgi:alpha-glucosidase (family GH31 glycosyl hydrolase)
MSRAGWAVVVDSASLVFDDEGWLAPRTSPVDVDLYFWGYGHDYLACLRDFFKVAGPTPLIPRWALGNWWSRYWAYSQSELIQLMEDFKSHGVPLSVCMVDIDWHLIHTGNASSGWTGYTWNSNLFPDPEAFFLRLRELGLEAALNLHPADGVYPHEAQYVTMAQRLGIDPEEGEPVPFDIADRRFVEAYFDLLHHPLEAQGVTFWWVDWQQGETTRQAGLDPLWWLNHLHFYDLGRDGQKRPCILSRWGGLGNHRYPIGFSGDTVVSWRSLAFQPYLTATAANVGYGWWSHDIGGHMKGIEDPELYTRWIQFGVFSPILRVHSTNNPYHERRPWAYDAETFRITRAAMQLRHALVPYLYSAAWQSSAKGKTLILPMYFQHPGEEAAYHCPNQYYFGSELIVAPYVTPLDPDMRLSRQAVWLPEGDWFDFFTGERFEGGRWHVLYGTLEQIPVLARAGGIVPMGPQGEWGGVANPEELIVHLFAGADNAFELYEDDGETQAYLQGKHCITPLRLAWYGDRL